MGMQQQLSPVPIKLVPAKPTPTELIPTVPSPSKLVPIKRILTKLASSKPMPINSVTFTLRIATQQIMTASA